MKRTIEAKFWSQKRTQSAENVVTRRNGKKKERKKASSLLERSKTNKVLDYTTNHSAARYKNCEHCTFTLDYVT